MEESHDVGWIECPACGGVYIVLANPRNPPKDGDLIRAQDFCGLDGQPYEEGSPKPGCLSCGALPLYPYAVKQMRFGDRLPLAIDTPVMEDFYQELKRQMR